MDRSACKLRKYCAGISAFYSANGELDVMNRSQFEPAIRRCRYETNEPFPYFPFCDLFFLSSLSEPFQRRVSPNVVGPFL